MLLRPSKWNRPWHLTLQVWLFIQTRIWILHIQSQRNPILIILIHWCPLFCNIQEQYYRVAVVNKQKSLVPDQTWVELNNGDLFHPPQCEQRTFYASEQFLLLLFSVSSPWCWLLRHELVQSSSSLDNDHCIMSMFKSRTPPSTINTNTYTPTTILFKSIVPFLAIIHHLDFYPAQTVNAWLHLPTVDPATFTTTSKFPHLSPEVSSLVSALHQ